MGQTCCKKRQTNKSHQSQSSKMVLGDSHQLILTNPNSFQSQQGLQQYKQLCSLLQLVGNLDQLKSKTRDHIRQLFSQKNNCQIVIQNKIRRELRNQGLIRPPQQDDECILIQDKKFNKSIQTQLLIVAETIRILQQDQEFQLRFPTLCVSFMELADSIQSNGL
ncbi:unnamed protein product (macronuclear) [Paramecium tetraurelia]|uniref:Uncharacterized protein n=1 Tax=Paramecium tetraurelia TaxID=5888 RepID=A0D3W0_PARTE|nr:uncharacterized protein GSPATT00013192001 [Paramecium tetraurelia]CAK77727.1 unnamed protein product [Paramecium tetraurelia]|eukprot:XP_001445124.1 hypothetical protein (macronuclear) [Paramecium tetraurelia strain d4-2]